LFTRFFGLFAAASFLAAVVGHLLRLGGLRGTALDILRWTPTAWWLLALAVLAVGFVYRWSKRAHWRRRPGQAVRELTPTPERLSSQLDRTFLPLVTSGRLAGLVAATNLDGQVALRAYGDPRAVPQIDENTVFEIGSITETFAALLLAQMVLAGELGLDDPVSRHLPGVELGGATVLDLATHHAGLPRVPPTMWWAIVSRAPDPYSRWTQDRLDSAARRTLPRSEPGTGFHYSNFGFAILGLLLSRRAGVRYAQLVRERICSPLEMNDTYVGGSARHTARTAPGHDYFGGHAGNWHMGAMSPSGGIRSTAADMHRYLAVQLRPGESPLEDAIRFTHGPRRQFQPSWQARIRGARETRRIGLAWITTPQADGTKVTWHNGGTGGYGSFLGFNADRQAGIVALSNSVHSYRLDNGCLEVLREATPTVSSATA
jgi:serine-type D-Ala-D-Ala carboxypeptidase/endopeptidase